MSPLISSLWVRYQWLLWLVESIFHYNGITLMYVYSMGIRVVIIIVAVLLLLSLHAIYLFDSSPHKTVCYGSSILRWMLGAQFASFILPQVPLGVQPGDSLGRGGNYGEWFISTNIIKLHDVHKSSQGLYSLSRLNIFPQDLAKSWSRKIWVRTFPITLKFDADMPVKF